VAGAPFKPSDFPNPTVQKSAQNIQQVNLLETTLATTPQAPFKPVDWQNPAVRKPVQQPHPEQGSLPLIEYNVPYYGQDNQWPNPIWPKKIQQPDAGNTLPLLTATPPVKPFKQDDWQNPVLAKKVQTPDILNTLQLLTFTPPPAGTEVLRQPLYTPRYTRYNAAAYHQIDQYFTELMPPTVIPPVVIVPVVALGAPDHRPPRKFSAEINGKFYYFDSLAELRQVLSSFKTKQKKNIAKTVEKRVIPVTLPHVEIPVHLPTWAVKEIEKTNVSLEKYYWAKYQQLMDQDEDDAIIALYG
jgi:hypothetical protein